MEPSCGGGGLEGHMQRSLGTGCESHGESSLPLFGGVAGVEGTVIDPRLAVQAGPEFSVQGAVCWPRL